MRLLFLTDFFPPEQVGGFELRCAELAESLRERGHAVHVLSGRRGGRVLREPGVWRVLHYGNGIASPLRQGLRDAEDARWLARAIESFRPDLVVVFGVFGLSPTLFSTLARFDVPVVYDEGGYGLIHLWKRHGSWLRFCSEMPADGWRAWAKKRVIDMYPRLGAGVLATAKSPGEIDAYFNSDFSLGLTRRAGVRMGHTEVIPSGIRLEEFPFHPRRPSFPLEVHLFVPGRIHPDKGQVTAVRAVGHLSRDLVDSRIRMRLIGKTQDATYASRIADEIRKISCENRIEILPAVPRSRMREQYAWADLVLFPSEYEEPFSRIPLEAMASGRPLISTSTGGTAELVNHGENALVFTAGDPAALAASVKRLGSGLKLYDRLAKRGRAEVEEKYEWGRYVNRVERFLGDCLNHAKV